MSSGEGADFRIVPNANVPSGEAFVSSRLNETADDGNCIGKQIVISTESIYGSDSMTVKISKTYSKSNLEKLTGVTYKDSQSGDGLLYTSRPTPFMRITEIVIYREMELLQLMLQANTRLFAPVWVCLLYTS